MNSQSKKTLKVCVLGNFSGRNAGDNAILGNLVRDVSALYPNVHFLVPTINPKFVEQSFGDRVSIQGVSLMPWALSVKIFGLPVFRAVLGSDLVLVTDNILFDMKLFNPLFNYLSTLSLVLPMAKKRGIPVVLYNMSLGPVSTPAGTWCMKRVINSVERIILRDQQSKDLLDRLNVSLPPVDFGADSALNTEFCSAERLQEIVAAKGLFTNPNGTIGFNVNVYLDQYLKHGARSDTKPFIQMISGAIDQVIDELDVDILFFVTQVMDIRVTNAIIDNIKNKQRIKTITNKEYSFEELTAVMSKLLLMVAMRTHALILASSAGTPVAGIISYPKTTGYLKTIGQGQWIINFEDLETDRLFDLVASVYHNRDEIKKTLLPAVEREKQKAAASALTLQPWLGQLQKVS
ncbi:MAG: hypothetical protein D6768_00365 [Chloroflexi bacterium]|nr:MAG: hypothetical protein D6768_00365 [Chloroflexota bacterium]